nr:hypothetical protein [Tanacetum cinerariifolium]
MSTERKHFEISSSRKRVFPESSSGIESKGDVALLSSNEAVNRKHTTLKRIE